MTRLMELQEGGEAAAGVQRMRGHRQRDCLLCVCKSERLCVCVWHYGVFYCAAVVRSFVCVGYSNLQIDDRALLITKLMY